MSSDIKVSQDLQEVLNRLRVQSPALLERAISSELIPIVTAAKAAWPKKTGNSARALRIRVENENNRIVRYVENNMPYAGAVHPKDVEELSRDTLVFEPIAKALQPMLEAFARALGKV